MVRLKNSALILNPRNVRRNAARSRAEGLPRMRQRNKMAESAELKVKRSQKNLLLIWCLIRVFLSAWRCLGVFCSYEAVCQVCLKRSSYIGGFVA